jgi:hypothetical protein
MPALHFPSD